MIVTQYRRYSWRWVHIFKLWPHTWHSAECYSWGKRCVNAQKHFPIHYLSTLSVSISFVTSNIPETTDPILTKLGWVMCLILKNQHFTKLQWFAWGAPQQIRDIIALVLFDIPSWIFVKMQFILRNVPHTDITNWFLQILETKWVLPLWLSDNIFILFIYLR